MRLTGRTIGTAGVLTAVCGLATVWLFAAPLARQAETRVAATTGTSGETGAGLATTKVRLRWDPSTDTDLAGYVVSWGDGPGKYRESTTVGPDVTSVELDVAPRPEPYFVAIQARNRAGKLGGYSNEFGLDLSSGTPQALKPPKASKSSSSKVKTPKPKLTPEEKAQRRREKQERKRKAQEAGAFKPR